MSCYKKAIITLLVAKISLDDFGSGYSSLRYYYFLGKANYVEHHGSKPINFIWQLEEKIPQVILREAHMKAVVE